MTAHKHLKQLVRARMKKTGEGYATARRQVTRQTVQTTSDPALHWHFPGNVPATSALRVLLAHAGVRDPRTKEPFSEAMLFAIAGGIGIGMFSFFYEKDNFASFFIAGRHGWQDDLTYLKGALQRFGIKPVVQESTGAKAAEKQLRDMLAKTGPCIAWVDAANLPHRAMPPLWSGGGYHVITVYRIDDDKNAALIGDLSDEPIPIALADLAIARERIKKQKHRLLGISPASSPKDLAAMIRDGLRACHAGLTGRGGVKSAATNFSLEVLRVWATRMHGSKDKERWERVFAPPRIWRGLVSIYDFIEHYGTGGGLCRPLFADSLSESADALGNTSLRSLSERYAELGQGWSELAHAALPDEVPLLRATRELHVRKAELTAAGAPIDEIRAAWSGIDELERQVKEKFPLTDSDCAELRAGLQARIAALYEEEKSAHAALGDALS